MDAKRDSAINTAEVCCAETSVFLILDETALITALVTSAKIENAIRISRSVNPLMSRRVTALTQLRSNRPVSQLMVTLRRTGLLEA